MFKAIESFFSPNNKKLPAQQAVLLIAALIFITGLVISIFLASMIARQSREDYRISLLQRNNALQSQLSLVIDGYGRLLYSGATMFRLKGDVSREEWSKFYVDMKVSEELPDTLGVGYTPYMTPDGVSSFEEKIRQNDIPDFTVYPTFPRKDYTAILYLEPFNDANKRAVGYDMMSEPQRNAAMTLARDTGKVAMSAPVVLVQDEFAPDNDADTLGVLIYYPVYRTPNRPETIEERRAALQGFVYIAVRPQDILEGYASQVPQIADKIQLAVRDVTDGSDDKVADVNNAGEMGASKEAITRQIEIANRTWETTTQGRPPVLNSTILPGATIATGTLASLIVSALILQLMLKRIERIEHSYAAEVERTKDELLALASHQLRTPASGVKQYIGILTSGIMGELTPSQQQIAEKAYVTNERQIEIINQLLYVSKIEAGKITIRPAKSNITPILQRIIDQSRPNAERKNIKISFRTKIAHYIYGDEQYYPMIVDNLISNAIKYSHPDTTVSVKVSQRDDMLAVAVVDHGVGIELADTQSLFQKFNRIENPLSRSEGGSGLGLYLAYQLAKAHGGDIEVKSTIGKGSTFTLLMPKNPGVEEAVVDIVDYSGDILPR